MDPENHDLSPEKATPGEYEKPAITWEEQLDVRRTLAVACGKTPGGGGQCNNFPTS